MTVRLEDIEAAARTIAGKVTPTPSLPAPSLSKTLGADIVLKLENLQLTGSFKTRGALVKLASLTPAEARRGVVAMSAGNHAQGVAYHARALGIRATIVMPETTPFTKVEHTEELGARVILEGKTLAQCRAVADGLARRERLVFIHPYDDPAIIAGQGTIGLEMLADDPDLDAIVVPVGGGGLIAGIATAAKALNPKIRIVGVQTTAYPAMALAMTRGGTRAPADGRTTLADGIAVKAPGKLTRAIARRLVDEVRQVDEADIEAAIQMLVNDEKLVVEGAGAVPLAALMAHRLPKRCRRIGLVISGGNIDSRLLANVLMRGLAREGRIARLRIELSDAPGTLAQVSRLIGEADGNIIEIVHHRLFSDVPARMTEIDVMVETQDAEHLRAMLKVLNKAGYNARRLRGTADGTAD
jgi:threonine dehydratase